MQTRKQEQTQHDKIVSIIADTLSRSPRDLPSKQTAQKIITDLHAEDYVIKDRDE